MPDIRQHILDEVDRRGWTRNRFAQLCADEDVYHRTSTLAYLRGDHDVATGVAGKMLDLLDLAITPATRKRAATR